MKVKLKSQAIRRILARKYLSQNWLAQRIGTSSGYMSQTDGGEAPSIATDAAKILGVLQGCAFDDLFTLQGR